MLTETTILASIKSLEAQRAQACEPFDMAIAELRQMLSTSMKASEAAVPDLVIQSSIPSNSQLNENQVQALSLFQKLKTPLRLSDFNREMEAITGEKKDYKETLRWMNSLGMLVLMKLNNANRLSFYVLPEWVDKANTTLFQPYKIKDMDTRYKGKIEFL